MMRKLIGISPCFSFYFELIKEIFKLSLTSTFSKTKEKHGLIPIIFAIINYS